MTSFTCSYPVLRSGREVQARPPLSTVAPHQITPDEYPTFTRPISPELDESERYTQEPPKRKRTNPWSFRHESDSSESLDDFAKPLTRKLSRRASAVFAVFTPQRSRSSASAIPPRIVAEEFRELEEQGEPAAKRRQVTLERRRSSLQKIKELVTGRRKDSVFPGKTLLPAPTLDEDDLAMGLFCRPSPPMISDPFVAADPELVYMTGALPLSFPEPVSPDKSAKSSLDPILDPTSTDSTHQKASTASVSLNSESSVGIDPHTSIPNNEAEVSERSDYLPAHFTGDRPTSPPDHKQARHRRYNSLRDFVNRGNSLRKGLNHSVSRSPIARRFDNTTALSTRCIAPWEPPETSPPKTQVTPTIGILPSVSSVDTTSQASLPIFASSDISPTNSSIVALHTSSTVHPSTSNTCPPRPAIDPTIVSDNMSDSIAALPSPCVALPQSDHLFPPAALRNVPVCATTSLDTCGAIFHQRTTQDAREDATEETRSSTAADTGSEGEQLRLRRSRSLRADSMGRGDLDALAGLEGMSGFEYVKRAIRWRDDCEWEGRR